MNVTSQERQDILIMVQFLQNIGIQATPENALVIVIALAAVAVLYVALVIGFFVMVSRTRKLKKMDKKLAELIEINKQLLELETKKANTPPPSFPMPQMPHMGSSWRRR